MRNDRGCRHLGEGGMCLVWGNGCLVWGCMVRGRPSGRSSGRRRPPGKRPPLGRNFCWRPLCAWDRCLWIQNLPILRMFKFASAQYERALSSALTFRLVWKATMQKTNRYSCQESGVICAGDLHTSVQARNNECSTYLRTIYLLIMTNASFGQQRNSTSLTSNKIRPQLQGILLQDWTTWIWHHPDER